MKKRQSNCKCSKGAKRRVFRIRNTSKQNMLQSKALLSEHTLKVMLNGGLERPYPLNVQVYPKSLNMTESSFLSQPYKNHTVH